jgi:hypothetical protein
MGQSSRFSEWQWALIHVPPATKSKRASIISLRQVGGNAMLKSLMASKSLFGHYLFSKSLNVLASVPSPGPTMHRMSVRADRRC